MPLLKSRGWPSVVMKSMRSTSFEAYLRYGRVELLLAGSCSSLPPYDHESPSLVETRKLGSKPTVRVKLYVLPSADNRYRLLYVALAVLVKAGGSFQAVALPGSA